MKWRRVNWLLVKKEVKWMDGCMDDDGYRWLITTRLHRYSCQLLLLLTLIIIITRGKDENHEDVELLLYAYIQHGTSIFINKNVIIIFPKRKVIKIEEKGFQIMYLLLQQYLSIHYAWKTARHITHKMHINQLNLLYCNNNHKCFTSLFPTMYTISKIVDQWQKHP